MNRRRFYAPREAFDAEAATVSLTVEEARHLRDVLRLKAGDEAHVFDGAGREFLCVVLEPGRGSQSARLAVREEVRPARPESGLDLVLALALLKGEKFDLVVQKATELGVTRILPIETKRADVRLRDAADAAKRAKRWQRLALEAAKQSGRACLPEVAAPQTFSAVINAALNNSGPQLRLLFTERGGQPLAGALKGAEAEPSSLIALVGPEGGWEDGELSEAEGAGWSLVTLGGRILRAETAAITVVALLQHLHGDLG